MWIIQICAEPLRLCPITKLQTKKNNMNSSSAQNLLKELFAFAVRAASPDFKKFSK
jgi:hypothetical protein